VHVEVHHRLASGLAHVDPDVVPVGMKLRVELLAGSVEGGQERGLLFRRGLEEPGDVPPGDEQGMPGRHGVAVA
jgi:hypothetical protein